MRSHPIIAIIGVLTGTSSGCVMAMAGAVGGTVVGGPALGEALGEVGMEADIRMYEALYDRHNDPEPPPSGAGVVTADGRPLTNVRVDLINGDVVVARGVTILDGSYAFDAASMPQANCEALEVRIHHRELGAAPPIPARCGQWTIDYDFLTKTSHTKFGRAPRP
jgi:hypothetical protein